MTPFDVQIPHALSVTQKDKLLTDGVFATTRDGMPFTNDDPISDPRESAITAITARCHMFKLYDEDHRNSYADLLSKIHTGTCVELLWEDRVKTADGLVVYITVLEYAQITKKTIEGLTV